MRIYVHARSLNPVSINPLLFMKVHCLKNLPNKKSLLELSFQKITLTNAAVFPSVAFQRVSKASLQTKDKCTIFVRIEQLKKRIIYTKHAKNKETCNRHANTT